MDAYLIEVNNLVDKTKEINVWLPEDTWFITLSKINRKNMMCFMKCNKTSNNFPLMKSWSQNCCKKSEI
jgi:hypothetical protein